MKRQKQRKAEKRRIPKFRDEREEREFWETHDTDDYVDWSRGRLVTFPNLRVSTTTISLRLPEPLLADLKVLANKRDVPYQSLLKVFLAERIAAEQRAAAALPARRMTRAVKKRSSHRVATANAAKRGARSRRQRKKAGKL